MSSSLKIALAQVNFCVGDIHENAEKMIDIVRNTRRDYEADLIVFPELALTGYPPEDLLFRPGLHRRVSIALSDILKSSSDEDIWIVIGYPEIKEKLSYNSAAVFHQGRQIANYRKAHLPNYSVFDEKRYFNSGTEPCVVSIRGLKVGFNICEDIWNPENAMKSKEAGAELICNINASPFHIGKAKERIAAVKASALATQCPVAYANAVGGQDELVFDGGSFALDSDGNIAAMASFYEEEIKIIVATKETDQVQLSGSLSAMPTEEESIYHALVLGVRDYVRKNRFKGCVIGLSGGIDSALTLAVAVDALGPEAVTAVSMPSRYTADMSIEDAKKEAEELGCSFYEIQIENITKSYSSSLEPLINGGITGVTAENLQARTRGVLLMALSNANGNLVLATGNKSEMAVGYATLYGDMAGGFAPIKDVSKTWVYRLAKWRNKHSQVIPNRVITREPSAELAPDQKDSDSLPEYDILDPILERYIEKDMTPREIAVHDFDLETVRRIAQLVDRNEYKRRQAAPGVRITSRAFGRDRRFPITSRYHEQKPALK
jgi:NAD+ synthase (glutamine-hydrolysing)